MRCFDHIATLIRTKRETHPKKYSQSELSRLLGYKSGQFISNVERGMCSIPLKMLGRVSKILNIPSEELKREVLKDQETTLENYLQLQETGGKSDLVPPSEVGQGGGEETERPDGQMDELLGRFTS